MGGQSSTVRLAQRALIRAVAAAAIVVGASVGLVPVPERAGAMLSGSPFNGADASPVSDLAAGAVAVADPVGNQDTSNYAGSTEDDVCPAVQTGTASPKDDLDLFYFGSSGAFLYVGWHRPATNGTTTIDFELNRLSGAKPDCNGVNPARSAGDLLITYDFLGSGPFALHIQKRVWIGTADAGAWGPPAALPAGSFEASIDAAGAFGELVVNLTLAEVLTTVGCESFTSVFPKSRSSSSSFTNAIKDYVPPRTATVSNCGSIPVHKQDDTGAAMAGVAFDLYTDVGDAPGAAVVPAQSCSTDASGDCTIRDVLPGTYWVVERAAPTGYTGADPQKIVVALSGNTPSGAATFVNARKPARVDIEKTDDTGAALAGAGFTLYTDVEGEPGSAVSGKACTTGSDGMCSITDILPPGLYWVVETTTPAGHATADAQQVDLDLGETAGVEFENVREPIGISLVKTVDGARHPADDPLVTESGDEVTYVLTVENTGELALTITALADSREPDVLQSCEQGLGSTLEPEDDFTCTYTAAPTEDVENEASVTGTDVLGRTTSADDSAFVAPIHPAIRVEKMGPAAAHEGDEVTYTFTVTNPGDISLTDVTLTDAKCASEPSLASKANGDDDDALHPGETWTYTCRYTVAAADEASVSNEVEVAGTDPLGTVVTWDDEYVFPVLRPAIDIEKSADPTSVSGSGTVTYTYVVANIGNTALFGVSVDDDVLGHIGDIAHLEPGEARTVSTSVLVGPGSPSVNVGTATGEDRLGLEVTDSDTAAIAVVLGETFVRTVVELPRTGMDAGHWMRLAALLLAVGAALVRVARRRRPAGQSFSR